MRFRQKILRHYTALAGKRKCIFREHFSLSSLAKRNFKLLQGMCQGYNRMGCETAWAKNGDWLFEKSSCFQLQVSYSEELLTPLWGEF